MRLALLLFLAVAFTTVARAYPPYHDISDTAAAQAEAKERGLPLAYLGYVGDYNHRPSAQYNSDPEIFQMALQALQDRAVVITFDGSNMGPVPDIVHAQYHIQDDGPLPNGAAWEVPKIVFADPGITKTLGRVSHTDMAAGRESPIENALDAIKKDPTSLTPKPKPPQTVLAASGDIDNSQTEPAPQFGTFWWGVDVMKDRWPFFVAGFAIMMVAVVAWAARNL